MARRCSRSVRLALTAVTVATICGTAPSASAASTDWSVSGPDGSLATTDTLDGGLIRVQAYPGARTPGSVVLTAPMAGTFAVGTAGLSAPGGTPVVGAPNGPDDAARWLVVPESTVSVTADEPATVTFAVAAPDTAAPGDHAAAITVTDEAGETRRVGVLIRIPDPQSPAGQEPALTFDTVDLRITDDALPFTASNAQILYTATNSGSTTLVGDFSVGVQTLFGTRIASPDTRRDIVLLPGTSISGSVELRLPPTVRRTPYAAVAVDYTDQAGNRTDYSVDAFGVTVDSFPVAELGAGLGALTVAGAAWTFARRHRRATAGTECADSTGKGTNDASL